MNEEEEKEILEKTLKTIREEKEKIDKEKEEMIKKLNDLVNVDIINKDGHDFKIVNFTETKINLKCVKCELEKDIYIYEFLQKIELSECDKMILKNKIIEIAKREYENNKQFEQLTKKIEEKVNLKNRKVILLNKQFYKNIKRFEKIVINYLIDKKDNEEIINLINEEKEILKENLIKHFSLSKIFVNYNSDNISELISNLDRNINNTYYNIQFLKKVRKMKFLEITNKNSKEYKKYGINLKELEYLDLLMFSIIFDILKQYNFKISWYEERFIKFYYIYYETNNKAILFNFKQFSEEFKKEFMRDGSLKLPSLTKNENEKEVYGDGNGNVN